MGIKIMENTLFLGNGFTCSVLQNMPSMDDLFGDRLKDCVNDKKREYEKLRLSQEWE